MLATSSRAMDQAAQHSGVRASSVEVPSGTGSGLHSYCDLIAPACPLTWCTELVLEGITLPEGAVVTVIADDDRPPIKLPPDLQAELEAAIDEADAEEGGTGPEFLESLKRYG